MSTRELEQALAASKWKGAEKNVAEVIAKMFGFPVDIVERVVFAWETVKTEKFISDYDGQRDDVFGSVESGANIEDEIRSAIKHGMFRGLRRTAIRWHMENGKMLEVEFKKLVPKDKPAGMCNGCKWQLECVRDMLSTPERCWNGVHVYCKEQYDGKASRIFQHNIAIVRPLKLEGNIVTVEADHPRGTFAINVMDVRI